MVSDGPVIRALRRFTSRPAGVACEETYWAGLTQLVGDISEAEIQLIEPAEAGGEGASYIAVPVFSAKGEVAYEISISGFRPGLSAADIERFVDAVRDAAARATMRIDGSVPWIGAQTEPAKVPGRRRRSRTEIQG